VWRGIPGFVFRKFYRKVCWIEHALLIITPAPYGLCEVVAKPRQPYRFIGDKPIRICHRISILHSLYKKLNEKGLILLSVNGYFHAAPGDRYPEFMAARSRIGATPLKCGMQQLLVQQF